MNNSGNAIKTARKAKGLTQKQLADLLGCSNTTISKYEQGEIENMPRPRMKKLADILGVSPVVLFGLTPEGGAIQKKNDILSDIVIRMQTDDAFRSAVISLYKLDQKKLLSVLTLLD